MPRQGCAAAPGSVLRHRSRLDDCIALGGVGEVWRGTDLVLRRVVAVKLLRPEYTQDEECLARFRAEGRHAALLSHPNIAQVYDYVEKAPPLAGFLVMELVDGQSLARLLAGGRSARRGPSASSPRRPEGSRRPMRPAWSTAISSRGTCWSAGMAMSRSPTSGSPR